jgi:hypothetical protein
MADNVKIVPSVSGSDPAIATDDIGSVHYQKIKAGWGPDGTWNETEDAAGKRFPVTVGMDAITPTHSTASPTTSSGSVLTSNASRKYALLINIGSVDVWIKLGATAVASQGIPLYANGGFYEISSANRNLYTGVINGITASGTGSLVVTEGT